MTEPSDPPSRAARPTPDGSARATTGPASRPARRGPITQIELQPANVVAAAGGAVVTAARMGRLLGRAGWRLARQVPGARTMEREAQRLQRFAASEARRVFQAPQSAPTPNGRPATRDEQRTIDYIRNADPGTDPLRGAMRELLERSVESSSADSREYLFGTIISQLVPDEARILAALADGSRFATVDVVLKQRRGRSRVLLANASAVGRQAALVAPDSTPTYVTRLHGFGLVEFGPEDDTLSPQYDALERDPSVQRARTGEDRGSVRFERKVLAMSAFGRDFWTASDPTRPALPPR